MLTPDPTQTVAAKRQRKDVLIGLVLALTVITSSVLCAGCDGRGKSGPDRDSGLTLEGPPQTPGPQRYLAKAELARLVSVTDGDTLVVTMPTGSRANIRIIGIDAPETYPQLECGGRAATIYMKTLVTPGDLLQLYTDKTQDIDDRYGRALRFVYTENNLDVGLQQVSTGHARVYVYRRNPFTLVDNYRAKERAAQQKSIGIWGAC